MKKIGLIFVAVILGASLTGCSYLPNEVSVSDYSSNEGRSYSRSYSDFIEESSVEEPSFEESSVEESSFEESSVEHSLEDSFEEESSESSTEDSFEESFVEESSFESSPEVNYSHWVYFYSPDKCLGTLRPTSWETLEIFFGSNYTGFFRLTDSRQSTVQIINFVFSESVSNTGSTKLVIDFLDDDGRIIGTKAFIMRIGDSGHLFLFDLSVYYGQEVPDPDSYYIFKQY